MSSTVISGSRFQSTPPRGKRLPGPQVDRQQLGAGVSIHAPAREATLVAHHLVGVALRPVSIHAPAREATSIEPAPLHATLKVSIHAPAREATQADRQSRWI